MKQGILLGIFLVILVNAVIGMEELAGLPDQFSWDNVNGVTYISPVKNQNFPYSCNSGWAFATIGMLEARIKKLRNAASPDISLSTQVLLSCDFLDYGCMGVCFYLIQG